MKSVEQQPPKKRGKTGPKPIEVDVKAVEAMRSFGCTQTEIADYYGMTKRHFLRLLAKDADLRGAFDRGVSRGNISLRRKQWDAAMNGNIVMQIWLGKQMLGQRDKGLIEHSGVDGKPIETSTTNASVELLNEILGIAARKKANTTIDIRPALPAGSQEGGGGDPEPSGV